jgi:hypothetical protein
MPIDQDFDRAANAMVAQHGSNALRVAEQRAERHELVNERDAAERWWNIARVVRLKLMREGVLTS